MLVIIVVLFCLDARINGHIFLSLNESRLERFRVSVGFQFAIMNIIEDIVNSGKVSSVALLHLVFVMYRKAAINLPVVRDFHYSSNLQEAVWLPPELHSIS